MKNKMKKYPLFFFIFVFLLPGLYADDVIERTFEISFGVGANLSNTLFSVRDIFTEILVVDLDKLALGVKADFGAEIPAHLNLNFKTWGIGIFSGIDVSGALGLNENMLSLKNATNAKSDLNAAIYFAAGIDSFFHLQQFKVKFKPAVFYPLLYAAPQKMYYTFDSPDDKNRVDIGYDMRVYTAFPIDINTGMPDLNLTAVSGLDFSAGIEYPLSEVTGLEAKYPFLDFDVGLDFINIPIISSIMKNYIQSSGNIYFEREANGNISDLINSFSNEMNYSTVTGVDKGYSAERAFKMHVWADWRPLPESSLLTITPVLGFANNALFFNPFSLEGGLNLKLSLKNMFIFKAGINYEDRIWRNSVNLAFNCRLFQIDVGADVRSADFAGSWTAKGFNARFGFRLGW